MAKTVNYGGYEITIEKSKISGHYQLSAEVYSMGEAYIERMKLAGEPEERDYEKFVQQIERGR